MIAWMQDMGCWDTTKGAIDSVLQNSLVKQARLLVSLGFAIASYASVCQDFNEKFVNTKLELSFSPPNDRCVPYFELAQTLMTGQEPNSILYDYVDGEPQVRQLVCPYNPAQRKRGNII